MQYGSPRGSVASGNIFVNPAHKNFQPAPPDALEMLTVQALRAVAITAIQTLVWLAAASGTMVASASAAEPPSATSPDAGPQAVMEDLSTHLFAALDKNSGAIRRNVDKVLPLVDRLLSPHFDLEYAARLVLGQHWRSATPAQREQFAVALYQRLLRTYVVAVSEWTADRVKILPLRSDAEALQVTVHTEVKSTGGAIVPVDYRLHQTAEGWKIFDVVVEGVSYVRNYHDDTSEDVAQKGLDATIARLARTDVGAIQRVTSPNPPSAR
jgi:phospholipid transport system substrate-binding protein